MFDYKMKPWLLEVNLSPSLSSSSAFDKNIKTRLICDTLTLVGIKPYDKQKYRQEQEKIALARRNKGLISLNHSGYGRFYDSKLGSKFDSSDAESDVLNEFIEQQTRLGNYERIFPLEFNVNYYSQFFERERVNNELIRRYI